MSEFTVSSSFGDYAIEVASGAARRVSDVAVALVDPVVADRVAIPPDRIVTVIGSEDSKTLSACEGVLVAMHQAGLKRGDLVAAVGGGVVQDVATLTTSLYMRGVDWVYVPTTLMAMADSCIGGKSSINAGGVKNLVGNFHPPVGIVVDPRFIETLPQRAVVSGLGEAVKICYARGRDAFDRFLEFDAALTPGADEDTVNLLTHVLTAKKWFVEVDEFDKAERHLLNFGHSFGHAWESACHFSIQHGVGVAAGVLAAVRHPQGSRGELTGRLEEYCEQLLSTVKDDVASALDQTDWDVFLSSLRSDKKNGHDVLRLVLPQSEASVRMVELPLDDNELDVARAVLLAVLEDVVS